MDCSVPSPLLDGSVNSCGMAFKSVTPEAESGGDCGSDSRLLAAGLSVAAAAAAAAIDEVRAEKRVEGRDPKLSLNGLSKGGECE